MAASTVRTGPRAWGAGNAGVYERGLTRRCATLCSATFSFLYPHSTTTRPSRDSLEKCGSALDFRIELLVSI